MKILPSFVLLLALALPFGLRAEDSARPAKLVAINGQVTFTLPGGNSAPVTVGTVLPVGTAITTSPGALATVEFFDGTVTIVQPESDVTIAEHSITKESGENKENTLLDLRAGGVVNSLDPAKKKVTNFKVRTPKGVAAARGTVFAVRINNTGSSVTTMAGTVTFVTDQGEFTVAFGQVSGGSGVSSVADAVKGNPNLAKDILEATAMVATAVGNGTVGNTEQTPNLISTVLAAIVDVAVQVAPGNAAQVAKDVIAAAAPALQGSNGAAVVEAVAQAAAQAATKADPSSTTQAADIITTTRQAAADAGVKVDTTASPDGGTTSSTPILPPLDQTQVIVSPSS